MQSANVEGRWKVHSNIISHVVITGTNTIRNNKNIIWHQNHGINTSSVAPTYYTTNIFTRLSSSLPARPGVFEVSGRPLAIAAVI